MDQTWGSDRVRTWTKPIASAFFLDHFFGHFSLIFHHSQHLLVIFQLFSAFFRISSRVFNSPHVYSMNNTHPCSNPPIFWPQLCELTVFGTTHVSSPPSMHFTAIFNCQQSLSIALSYYKVFQALRHTFHPFFTHFPPFSPVFNTCSFSNAFSRVFSHPLAYSMNNAHSCSNPPISGPN